jgi:predicted nucleic acid-binding Zn ribbon protein
MFRKKVQTLDDVINQFLRHEGLETPLLQRRLMDSWEKVAGKTVMRYTGEKFIRNQTLFVKILNPALRADLSMMRTELVRKLNAEVGSMVITELRLL